MRFQVFPQDRLTDEVVKTAYLSGIDRIGWPVRKSVENGELYLQRAVSDSACLQFPWNVGGQVPLMLTTGTLLERSLSYMLPLELARGTVHQLRTQLYEWQSIGLVVAEPLLAKIAQATRQLSNAVVEQNNSPVCAELSEICLQTTLDAAGRLAACYIGQSMLVRRRSGMEKSKALMGGDLGFTLLENQAARQFLSTFNAANVPLCWRDIEASEGRADWTIPDTQFQWAKSNGLAISAGPLLLLESHAWPDWLTLWEDDFESIREFIAQFIRKVVARYRGKVDFWQAAGRMNTTESLSLNEEEKLRLTAMAVEIITELDPGTPVIVNFDQPWAEYMSHRDVDFPPLHFADALLRSDLDISGLGLEINLGYHPGGTLNRNLLEFSRLLDIWSIFGLPLWISFCVPSATDADSLARRTDSFTTGGWTPAAQQAWVAHYLPLILAKPFIQGIYWNQLQDSVPHDFPHGGLFDEHHQAKPTLRTLAILRQALLK